MTSCSARCPPCVGIAPAFAQLAKDHEGSVVFIKVDVDKADDVSADCKISAMPTFLFYKNGEKVDELVGASEAQLKEKVAKNK